MMNKNLIISDKNSKSLLIKKKLLKIFKKQNSKMRNVVIVIGGDGFMLQTLKRNKNINKLFYGINSGNYGFLMNKFSKKNILKNITSSKLVKINPLKMSVINKQNRTKNHIAINEVSILRQSRQAASLKISNGNKIII